MKLNIPKDYFDGTPTPPRVFLCTTGKKIIGELPATNRSLNAKWGTSYSEFSFEIPRTYVDLIDGETKVQPLYDKVEVPRNIYVENVSYFSLQDINKTSSDNDIKSITCFDYAYSTLGNKYLNSFRINTGGIDSVEVMYNEKQHGYDYVIDQDSLYIVAVGAYKSDESYYIKEYVDKSWVWEQVQVKNAEDYATYFGDGVNSKTPLHIKNYPNIRFYWESNKELSLVHLVLASVPEWKVGHVDATLWRKERKFDEDRIDIYSFLTNKVADTFKCVVVFDSIEGTVNFYEETDDGLTEDGEIDELWDSDVIVSKDNLASSIEVKYNADDIRTKLKLSSSEGVNVREVNLGSDYIMNLDFYHNEEWMEQDLFEAYDDYLQAVKLYTPLYETEMKNWVAANNKYHDVVNAVPAENDVVMIGDIFEKLYCMFAPINTAFAGKNSVGKDIVVSDSTASLTKLYFDEAYTEEIKKEDLSVGDTFVVQGYSFVYQDGVFKRQENLATTASLKALKEKLYNYQVDKDVKGNVQDNILLTLKNSQSDSATIRIYAPKKSINPATTPYDDNEKYYKKSGNSEETYKYEEVIVNGKSYLDYSELYVNDYMVRCVIVRNSTGITDTPFEKSITEWLKGNLTAHKMGLVSTDPDSGKTTPDFTVKYIGTMGAYFVISKNEFVYVNDEWIPSEDYLRKYGVKLLQEKAEIYLKIFQTQTEAMYQNKDYQCVAQDSEPHGGNVPEGTRWFKTNSKPLTLYKRTDKQSDLFGERWESVETDANPADLKNYQRYIDNYQKLVVTQKVLLEKEQQAEYLLNGYAVPTNPIYYSEYKKGEDGYYRRNGQLLEGDMHRAAERHFCGEKVYASGVVDDSSKWNEINELYFNIDANKQPINPINKADLQNGAKYAVNGYSYQYDTLTQKFKRIYNSVYITRSSMDQELPLYTFTIASDSFKYTKADGEYDENETYYIKDGAAYKQKAIINKEKYDEYDGTTDDKTLYVISSGNLYAVYLQGDTPYVAYANSQGVYQMKKDYIANKAAIEQFFNEDQWIRLSPFIREDEYTNDDIITIEYDSEEEKNRIFKEFVEEASKELKTLSQPSLKFSMTMANILALPEFEPLIDQFQLGKFIRVGINDDYSKRARLLEVHLNFDDLSDFSCTFGDLKTTKDQVDLHAELLSQAVQSGSVVAKKQDGWQSAVDKSNALEESISNGLRDAALSVSASSGQNIVWDQRGILGRKLIPGTTDQYENEQFMLTNNKLVFTNSNWRDAKGLFGKFTVGKEERWGVLADAIVAGYLESPTIVGGTLQIGDPEKEGGSLFKVNENGEVSIISNGAEKYAAKSALTAIDNAYRFSIIIDYEGLTVFSDTSHECIITCDVYDYKNKITDKIIENETATGNDLFKKTFVWGRVSNDSKSDSEWKPTYVDNKPNKIKVSVADVAKNAQFKCQVDFDETKFSNETTENK